MLDLSIVKHYYGLLFEDALLEEIAKLGVYKEVKKDDILIEIVQNSDGAIKALFSLYGIDEKLLLDIVNKGIF